VAAGGGLLDSDGPLAQRYDVALLDLDGVVYLGADPVPGAPQALAAARSHGMRLTFVTNNAARTPEMVAAHLTRLGVPAARGDVVTSSQAAAHYLAERLTPGAKILVVGGDGLREAVRERGLTPVATADDDPAAVVQGYSPDVDWRMLAEGCVAINRGVPWVATNLDATVPSARGRLPGNGALVAALRHATGVTPVSTGKPDPTMHRETVERSGARRPLVVGDRLDTDIEGADRVGCDSLLVLTGVTDPADAVAAAQSQRPSYLGWDVGAVLDSHSRPLLDAEGGSARCAGWLARLEGGVLALAAPGRPRSAGSPLDALRTVCALSWTNDGRTPIRPVDQAAQTALTELRLL
jgi:glycerol-1-phosphatase